MANIPGLMKRNGSYYYRVRVPLDLVSVIGRTEIKESLKTKDYVEAKKRRNEKAIHWDAQFDAARGGLRKQHEIPSKPLSPKKALTLVQQYVEKRDREWSRRFVDDGPENAIQKQEMLIDVETSKQILQDPEDPRREENIASVGNKVLSNSGLELGGEGMPYPEFAELVRRGLIELYSRASARLSDDHSKPFYDHMFSQENLTDKSTSKVTLNEINANYLEALKEGAKYTPVSEKWIEKNRSTLLLIESIIGPDTPVVDIDYDVCVDFRNTLARVPKNRSKFYGDMPIGEVICAAEEDGRKMMAYATQKGCLQILTGVLKLARNKGLIGNVPSEDLVPYAENIPDADKRNSFLPDQLKAIFSAPLYTNYHVDSGSHSKPGSNDVNHARFWVPLIFLFTGMRPNEICQLYIEDLKVSEGGIHYFDIVRDKPDKKLKTTVSRRVFPVHPEILNIGFLDYYQKVKAGGAERLFPELTADKNGYYSTRLADWFSETFIKSVMKKEDRRSFYSLRHNFANALRHAHAPDWVLQALGAWTQGKKVSLDYGSKDWPELINHWVEKIEYKGLDLSHLHVKDN